MSATALLDLSLEKADETLKLLARPGRAEIAT
jgi:hypothetical protein